MRLLVVPADPVADGGLHLLAAGDGVLPRDGELGVAGLSLSPGLRSMTDRAGAAVPFTPASALLADLGGSASPPGG